jgi:hypothetical protein
MPSSTSSSDYKFAIGAFLMLLTVYLVGIELMTKLGLSRMSKIQRRMAAEYTQAVAIRPGRPKFHNVLLAGNSLMDASITIPLLKQELAPKRIHVTR